jgi:hypothetical protein
VTAGPVTGTKAAAAGLPGAVGIELDMTDESSVAAAVDQACSRLAASTCW